MKKFTLTLFMAILAVPMMLSISTSAKGEEVCATPSISFEIEGLESAIVYITNNEPGALVVYEVYCGDRLEDSGSFTGDNFSSIIFGKGFHVVHAVAKLDGKTDSPEGIFSFVIQEGEEPEWSKTSVPAFNFYTAEDNSSVYFVEINQTESSTIYYRVQSPDGTWTDWAVYEDILSFQENGQWRVEAYAVAYHKSQSETVYHEFVLDNPTGLTEVAGGKPVANVRCYNMAGQEMSQASGLTIVVTTYTDGTRNTVKVLK